ncbi:MAG: MarR family transcriptional regulator [Caldilineaceae bacterium]
MAETQTADPMRQPKSSLDVEDLPLHDLIPHWTSMLWLLGMRPMLQSLFAVNLTMSDNILLRQLRRRAMTIAAVADELSLTHSAASRTVDRLVRDGWVRRMENPVDRRQKILTLTPEGVALMEDIEGKLTAGIEYLAARLSPAEQEQFRRLIAHMVAANCIEDK